MSDNEKRMKTISDRISVTNSVNEEVELNKMPSTQDYVKHLRKITELVDKEKNDREINSDQPQEEEKFMKTLDDLNVTVEFEDLEVYDNLIFWGGTVDGTLQFVFKVTPDESTKGVKFKYLEGFSPDNPDNKEIIDRIENYYNAFYKYWRDNIFQATK